MGCSRARTEQKPTPARIVPSQRRRLLRRYDRAGGGCLSGPNSSHNLDTPRGRCGGVAACLQTWTPDTRRREISVMKAMLLTGHGGPEMLRLGEAPDPT